MILSTVDARAEVDKIRRARFASSALFAAARRVAWRVALAADAQQIQAAILALASCGHYVEAGHIEIVLTRFRNAA